MSVFAIAMLLGLGIAASVVAFDRARPVARAVWAVLAVLGGIGLAWAANFNLWSLWHVPVREGWIGITLTGVALGGIAYGFHELLGFFAGLHRKHDDEAAVLEQAPPSMRRAA